MYSVSPLPPIDTVHSHCGFWAVCAILLIAWVVLGLLLADEKKETVIGLAIGSLVLLGITGAISWTTGEVRTFSNVQVQGKLISDFAEGYSQTERSGKITHDVEYHYLYVVYEIEGRRVVFQSAPGLAWPAEAIFYRN